MYPCTLHLLESHHPIFQLAFKPSFSKISSLSTSLPSIYASGACLVAQTIKNLPAVRETCVGSLGWEDPLEEGMATHFSILVWRIPWTEEPGGLQSMGLQRVRQDWATFTFTLWLNPFYYISIKSPAKFHIFPFKGTILKNYFSL